MPLHDFSCPSCGRVLMDQYRSVNLGALAAPPDCPGCHVRMTWIPAVGAMDASNGNFRAFSCFDGRNQPVRIDSLRKLRQVERESEQLARDGEGHRMTWRHWSQDASNKDVHTHGEAPSQRPDPAFVRKFAKQVSNVAPEAPFGPGVNEANCSPLGVKE